MFRIASLLTTLPLLLLHVTLASAQSTWCRYEVRELATVKDQHRAPFLEDVQPGKTGYELSMDDFLSRAQ